MIQEAAAIPRGTVLDADVAIVGAGAAGISLALALRRRGRRVVLLESGHDEPDRRTTGLAEMSSSGEPYLVEASRLRYFGGSTNHWGGWTRPISDWVMGRRPWVADVGWPFDRTALDPYYDAAARVCEIPVDRTGRTEWSWEYWRDEYSRSGRTPVVDDEVVTGTVYRFSPPTRFGPRYRADLAAADDVRVVMGANALRVDLDAEHRATGLPVGTNGGNRFTVRAAEYVVAVGGLEVPRLLLLSAEADGYVPGNAGGHVGRWFMDHLEGYVGTVVLDRRPTGYLGGNLDVSRAACVLTPEVLAREELPATAVLIAEHADTGRSSRSAAPGAGPATEVWRAAGGVAHWTGDLMIRTESVPQRSSAVTLGRHRDALGQRRADLHYATSSRDLDGAARTLELLGLHLGRAGTGRIRLALDEREARADTMQVVGYHHMGTTRMAARPEDGVVDPDLRVHGTPNLSILSSSVFPTVGFSNPTLTIVALAQRLAERLAAR